MLSISSPQNNILQALQWIRSELAQIGAKEAVLLLLAPFPILFVWSIVSDSFSPLNKYPGPFFASMCSRFTYISPKLWVDRV